MIQSISVQDEKKLAYYFSKYARSLQNVVFERTGRFFHHNNLTPVDLVYLCPLCLKNKIGVIGEYVHYDDEFTLDHFPPKSVGGKNTVLVCKTCNSTTGDEFDFSLKRWLQTQCFNKKIPNSRIPVKLELQDTKGKYNGHLVLEKPGSLKWDIPDYPLVKEWFQKISQGLVAEKTITYYPVKMELVHKALLKAAYLYSFFIWGYDFVYSETATRIRSVLFKNETHVLSNLGIFFHMNNQNPPEGLCYVYKPVELQTFMINMKLASEDVNFECAVSVLIPGADADNWRQLKVYQPIIDNKDSFANAIIKLPEEILTKTVFPYTKTWKQRSHFRIQGEAPENQ